jgi:hypothetical protein
MCTNAPKDWQTIDGSASTTYPTRLGMGSVFCTSCKSYQVVQTAFSGANLVVLIIYVSNWYTLRNKKASKMCFLQIKLFVCNQNANE